MSECEQICDYCAWMDAAYPDDIKSPGGPCAPGETWTAGRSVLKCVCGETAA